MGDTDLRTLEILSQAYVVREGNGLISSFSPRIVEGSPILVGRRFLSFCFFVFVFLFFFFRLVGLFLLEGQRTLLPRFLSLPLQALFCFVFVYKNICSILSLECFTQIVMCCMSYSVLKFSP